MPIGSSPTENSRLEDFGLTADRELMRRVAIALLAFGSALEIMYSVAFNAPDWTDVAAIALVVLAMTFVLMTEWDNASLRIIIVPVIMGLFSVSLIAIGDGVAVGMPFFFLPAAVVMVFFWSDPVVKWSIMIPLVALYVIVPLVWGTHQSVVEALTTVPLLIGSSMLLGSLFNRFRNASVEQARFRGTITALLMALDARDDYTAEHSSEVLQLVMSVSEDIGLDEKIQLHVADVALLHDIGKIGIPNEILHKPAALTDDEWEVMRRHPEIGERILAEVPGFESVATAVRHEHERWDGGGYPDGIAGEEIPIASRIVLACDAYHAMTSERPYRSPMTETQARDQLLGNAGTQFDPSVVESLLSVLEKRSAAADSVRDEDIVRDITDGPSAPEKHEPAAPAAKDFSAERGISDPHQRTGIISALTGKAASL